MLRRLFLSFLYLCHRISIPRIAQIHTDFIPSEFRLSSADYLFPHGFHGSHGLSKYSCDSCSEKNLCPSVPSVGEKIPFVGK